MTTPTYLGVDLGGTGIKMALGDAEGRVLGESRIPTRSAEGPEAVLRRMGEAVLDLTQKHGASAAGIGMACPGTLDMANGLTKYLPNFPGNWRDVPVCALLSQQTNMPVYLLNDARTAALGELHFGAGKGVRTMVFMGIGTGLGGGVVVDGHLHLGPIGSAGELGHIIADPNGRLCGCGARGCLETIVSGPGLTSEGVRAVLSGLAPRLHELVEGDVSKVNTERMGQAAHGGDKYVRDAIERMARTLGLAIVGLVVALHPDLFVIGGGVAGLGDLLFDPLRRTVTENIGMFSAESLRIEPSMMGDRAGVLGAIALAMRNGKL